MSLTNLVQWSFAIVLGLLGAQHIDEIKLEILKATSRFVYESRSSTWGSPKFLETPKNTPNKR